MFILASNSPRRKELLGLLGVDFTIHAPDIDETKLSSETPNEYVIRIAKEKALSVAPMYSEQDYVLTADTIVVLGNEILGKPEDEKDAAAMLKKLSNKTHKVLTAFCLLIDGKEYSNCVETRVTFKKLNQAEIDRYVETGEAIDKAGAYAIQGFAAYMVKEIQGSYSNVVGLPLAELYDELLKAGYKFV